MIYLDNAATTKCSEETVSIVNSFLSTRFFNPSAQYKQSVLIRSEIDNSRNNIIKSLSGKGRIIFTSGGTESDSIALNNTKKKQGSKIIISSNEHSAIYYSALELRNRGFKLEICPTDNHGKLNLVEFENLLDESVSLISIMHVNNETGAVNDLKKIVTLARSKAPLALVHSDGVQAVGKIPVNLSDLDIDLYSLSAHKIGGMKGSGALFIKEGIEITPFLFGGGQEYGLRSSTENVAGIVSFARAIESRVIDIKSNYKKITSLFNILYNYLVNNEYFKVISDEIFGSKYILLFTNKLIKGEILQNLLESKGIIVGTGSACSSNNKTTRITNALKLSKTDSEGVIRVSFSIDNTENEIYEMISALDGIIREYKLLCL